MTDKENCKSLRQMYSKELSENILKAFPDVNVNALTNKVNTITHQDFAWNTINEIVNGDAERPNIWAVIGICEALKADYNDILEIKDICTKKDSLRLQDTNYMNHYYGFMYLRNEDFDEPVEIELIINEEPNGASAILQYTNKESGVNYKFYGSPMYNQSKDLIYIHFSNKEIFSYANAGDPSIDYYHFYFEYKKFDGNMHYRKGFCVSKSKNYSCPMIMNFCIFDRKIPLEDFKKKLRSLLAFSDSNFVIEKEKADKIIPDNKDISQFFEKGYSLSPVKEETVYIVDESIVTSNIHHMLRKDKEIADSAYLTLTKLKDESISPKRITYDNSQHDFIKRIMDNYSKFTKLFKDEQQQ